MQLKAIVVLFIMLYKVALTFEFVDEILKCDHWSESYCAILFCAAVYHAVQGGSNFWSVCEVLKSDTFAFSIKALLSSDAVQSGSHLWKCEGDFKRRQP